MKEAKIRRIVPVAHPTQVNVECPNCEAFMEFDQETFDLVRKKQGPEWVCSYCQMSYYVKAREDEQDIELR